MDPAQEIELSAFVRQKPMNEVIDRGDSNVQQFYAGATVFMTGGTGFIGKQLIEKLFRSCDIKKMYLLMRPKKSKTIEDRLAQLLKNPVYDSLRAKKPNFADDIVPVEGDIVDLGLGLSDKDMNILSNEVDMIFHMAATVRFDEPLRKATLTNIRSTREVIQLAKNCKNLKKFVHVSTAFSFATEDRIGKEIYEKFYPCPVPPETMISLAESFDEKKLDKMTKGLIEGWPNTYTFTKCIAEELVRTQSGDLPVCIVRPPIVLPTYYEPAPGWLDLHTIIGPSGIYLGAGLGVLRVFCADVNSNLSVAPLDYVNNTIIAAAWDSDERKKNGETDIPIYTVAKDLRFGFIGETMRKEKYKLASPKIVWRSEMYEVKNSFIYFILSWLLLYIPAYILDFICYVSGKRPKEISSFVDLYSKIDKLSIVYNYFTRNAFKFREDNVKEMINRMSQADRAIYNCNLADVDLKDYILVWGIGLRRYILRDGLTGTNAAFAKQRIFHALDYVVMGLYGKFVHVSTAFLFATEDRIGKEIYEKFYPCPAPPETMISLAESFDEKKLDKVTKGLIEGWPNTYTFTKCIAEELVRTQSGDLPVCIVRPPKVLPTYYEPAPGWLDLHTIIGPSGIYLGAGLGVLRVFCADVNSNLSVAPLDYVNNTIIAAAWDSDERKKNGETDIPIYTVAKDLRFGFIGETMRKEKYKLASPKIVWRSEMYEVKNSFIYFILSWLLLYIPAYILDFICYVSGKRPKEISSFVDLYSKIDKLSIVYNYFTRNAFKFREDNVKEMINRMSQADRAIYNCNLADVDLKDYILVWGIGLRRYILRDGLTGTNAAFAKQRIFHALDYVVMGLYGYVLYWICSSIYLVTKYILF